MVRICNEVYPSNSKYESYFELYPYSLSSFQKYAIEAIVEGHHALITAHTGSGKTLPAEFAIQYFVGQGKKVIYTSPIKALSNQKFYEFSLKYPDITFGLFTGDIKTNPNADVLIMTTEILMNYLFTSPQSDINNTNTNINLQLQFQIDIQRELACVIFDEVHYINDCARGKTWEQTILMLPEHIQMVMLSATIDNPEGFAKWCERDNNNNNENKKQVYLASTNHRIVPLTHYTFLTTIESVFKYEKSKEIQKMIRESTNKLKVIQTADGIFQEKNVHEMNKITSIFDKYNVFMKRKMVLNSLVEHLKQEEMLPAIAFVFSRKNVEKSAHEITTNLLEDDSKIPYIVRRECEQIIRKFPNFREYLELPEYNNLVSLLEKGIGIHHSGMIPVLREIVELMISKRYIKLLFATESFAIGLDCPIKTAIFTSLTKYDGSGLRYLMSHEYTQMAGRAGRRGIDTLGHVIHCNNLFPIPTMNEYREILCGKPQKLVSKFHISYSTILNLLKTNGGKCSVHVFAHFVNKSMLHNELNISKRECEIRIEKLKDEIRKKETMVQMSKTPVSICKRVIEIEELFSMLNTKKRKEAEREIANIKEEYRGFECDFVRYKDYLSLLNENVRETQCLNEVKEYILCKISNICDVLIEEGMLQICVNGPPCDLEMTYQLNEEGKIASQFAEIHSVIGTHIMTKWNHFQDFSERQIIGVFSCFTDIKVPEDLRRGVPSSNDSFLKENIEYLSEYRYKIADLERKYNLDTGIHYDDLLNYDIMDEIQEWANCETEEQCKYFIQTRLSEKEISVGDFTKAVLKIATINNEFMTMAENIGETELLYKLSKISPMILKYVTTSQSLYV
jgi:superfamily II RNA helicase